MPVIDFSGIRSIHCIGIGGVGISALARLLLHEGKQISGTNDNPSRETLDALREAGVVVSLDQNPEQLPTADCYIYSDAWLTTNPALLDAARATGKPVLSYFEALGAVSAGYDAIVVTGTHGKTTTTAMVTDILEAGGLSPTAVVGSLRAKTKSNFRAGSGAHFVVEGDEYLRHFLNLRPNTLVITNIEADHLDYYRDLTDIQNAFRELAQKVPPGGFVITRPNDPSVKPVVDGLRATVVDYTKEKPDGIALSVPGAHNAENALAALAVGRVVGVRREVALKAVNEFSGTWRRFEYKGKTGNGAEVYDDYAHHPTEIKATLRTAREKFPDKKIIAVFQPHLYSRTKLLMGDFARSFGDADEVIFAPIYAAREPRDESVTSEKLAEEAKKYHKNVQSFSNFESIISHLRNAEKDVVVFTIGAGDIYNIGEHLLRRV